jgi:CHAT domain-containing protein
MRKFLHVATAIGALGIGGCQEESRPVVGLDQARSTAAQFQPTQSFTPPPRSVDDVVAQLELSRPNAERRARFVAAASAQPPATADATELTEFYNARADAAGALGRLEQQRDDLARAREIGERGNVRYQVLRVTLRDISRVEFQRGSFNASVKALEDALAIQPASIVSRVMLLERFAAIGEITQARALLNRLEVEGARISANDPFAPWTLAHARFRVLEAEGRWREAEPQIRRAIDIVESPQGQSFPPGAGVVPGYRLALSRNLLAQDRFAEAEATARQSLLAHLRIFGRDSLQTAQSLSTLADVLAAQGRATDASRLARIALRIQDEIGVPANAAVRARAAATLGGTLVAERRWGEAARIYRDADRALAREPALQTIVFGDDADFPLALIRSDALGEARARLEALVARRERVLGNDHPLAAEARGLRGVVRLRQGEREAALADLREAARTLLAPGEAANAVFSGARGERSRLILTSLISATSRDAAGRDGAAEAFQLADALRGGGVQRAIGASAARASLGDPQLAELARREQDARHQLAGIGTHLNALLGAPADQQPAATIEALRSQYRALSSARQSALAELERRFPGYADLNDPRPATVAQAQAALRANEALIAIHAGEDGSHVWALRRDGAPSYHAASVTAGEIEQRVNRLRVALDPRAETLGGIPPFDVVTAHALFSDLLAPIAAGWRGADTLLIVTDGALARLPLAVMVTRAGATPRDGGGQALFASHRDVAWLARDAAVVQLPSVAALRTLRALPAGASQRAAFIGFGDPSFGAQQVADAAPPAMPRGVDMRAAPLVRRSVAATRSASSASLASLPGLPDTAQEIRDVAAALGADPARDALLGSAASEQAARGGIAANRRVVMFATHGLVPGDLDGLTQPALAMAAPTAPGAGDGLLTLDEILGMRLDADWVVLSACNTAAADGAGAEAVSGLGRAFFYAGSRAVLATHWPVETRSARLLTTELFRRQAADRALARGAALRQAMLALIDGPGATEPGTGRTLFSYAHPIFWAPFALIGDPG